MNVSNSLLAVPYYSFFYIVKDFTILFKQRNSLLIKLLLGFIEILKNTYISNLCEEVLFCTRVENFMFTTLCTLHRSRKCYCSINCIGK